MFTNCELGRKCRDCGQVVYIGELVHTYEGEDGCVREVCEKCLVNFLAELNEENQKKGIPAIGDNAGWEKYYREKWAETAADPAAPEWLRSLAAYFAGLD